ncbi:hypothetical protein L873DRAFT_1831457 [Choiromyces venosus 120613-1]|uniref:Uncharacterized protein n=1 Tax=Choiromyces venosus 120613-1 TaxID=1336337 RepID=A0A3N4J231_9PEZI|nr:hypothetical protein L873DRAFT_1831457 [Choiromyces venosus 120613-1]
MQVMCTNEVSFNIGGARGQIWVTRNTEEEYDEACLVPKFKKLKGLVIWGCFIGAQLGLLVFWDYSTWARITTTSYSTHILPILYDFWMWYGMQQGKIIWPVNSPDLNLIEELWH